MEKSSNKIVFKKGKKKKSFSTESEIKPVVKPHSFDGRSNWLKLQEILPPEEKKSVNKKNPARVFNHKRKFSKNSQQQPKCDKVPPQSKNKETTKEVAPYKFNFQKRSGSPEASAGSSNSKKRRLNGPVMEDGDTHSVDDINSRLTKCVAMDCEMVGAGPNGEDSMLARVSIVNARGECLYDTFVKPKDKITDYRTKYSGVRPENLKNAKDLFDVQRDVINIIEGRRVIGHALKNDFDVLFVSHPRSQVRDTSTYKPFRQLVDGRTPSLKKLTELLLNCDIQSGEHNSVEDARAAMLLYLRNKKEWEKSIKYRRKK